MRLVGPRTWGLRPITATTRCDGLEPRRLTRVQLTAEQVDIAAYKPQMQGDEGKLNSTTCHGSIAAAALQCEDVCVCVCVCCRSGV